MTDLPEPLRRWRNCYAGKVDLGGYPDGFVGDLRGEQSEPRLIVLGLNPGVAYPGLQGPHGEWTQAIKKLTYSRSSLQRVPLNNDAWRRLHRGRDSKYWINLINFGRKWLRDAHAGARDILSFEMFPLHSKNLTHGISPPSDIVETFIWQPLLEMEAKVVFAFGSDWISVCTDLLGSPIASYGINERPLLDATKRNWQVRVYRLADKHVVVSWQKGYAGPPSKNLEELRRVVHESACS
jgi:hypothetical protein